MILLVLLKLISSKLSAVKTPQPAGRGEALCVQPGTLIIPGAADNIKLNLGSVRMSKNYLEISGDTIWIYVESLVIVS